MISLSLCHTTNVAGGRRRFTDRLATNRSLLRFALLAACGTACSLYTAPTPSPAPAGVARRYARAEIVADLDSLFTMMERVHPNLYAVVSRDSVARARATFVASIPDSATRDQFYLGYARLVSLIGDGHTTISVPDEEYERWMANGGAFMPVRIEVDQANVIRITGAFGGLPRGIRRGDRLSAINGYNADSLLRDMMREVSGDTEYRRARQAAGSFVYHVWLHHIDAPFTLTTRADDGAPATVDLPGVTRDSMNAINARNSAARPAGTVPRRANLTYRRLDDGTGYIDFYSMEGDLRSFKSRLAEAFTQIERDSVRALVVDLRSNGGGDTRLGEAFLAHVTDRPYRLSAGQAIRASDDFRAFARSGFHPVVRWLHAEYLHPDGRKLFRAAAGTMVSFPEETKARGAAQPYFRGPVCVLIGPGTFSAAMQVADAIKTYRLAPLLGEDTGGLPTAFGDIYYFRLPRTGLGGQVSSTRFLRASGDSTDHGPVRPDIEIRRTPEDLRLGRDPALDRARHCSELPRTVP